MPGVDTEVRAVSSAKISLDLSCEEITVLIQLLEFAENDIHRVFKRLKAEDIDMKEIYYYYRYQGRFLRRKLRELRGY
jgi:hypothetical protein